jgi:hypothetical protein
MGTRYVKFVTAAAQVVEVDPDAVLTRTVGGDIVAATCAPAYVVLIPQGAGRPPVRAMRDPSCWKRSLLRLPGADPERLVLGSHCAAKGMQAAPHTFTALPPAPAVAKAPTRVEAVQAAWAERTQAATKAAALAIVHTGAHAAVRVLETEFGFSLDVSATSDDKRAKDTVKLVASTVTAMVDGVDVIHGRIYSCQTQEARAEAVELAVSLLGRRGHTVWRKAPAAE